MERHSVWSVRDIGQRVKAATSSTLKEPEHRGEADHGGFQTDSPRLSFFYSNSADLLANLASGGISVCNNFRCIMSVSVSRLQTRGNVFPNLSLVPGSIVEKVIIWHFIKRRVARRWSGAPPPVNSRGEQLHTAAVWWESCGIGNRIGIGGQRTHPRWAGHAAVTLGASVDPSLPTRR